MENKEEKGEDEDREGEDRGLSVNGCICPLN